MKDSYCPKCSEKHTLYYLLKADNATAMFLCCPNYKPGHIETIFLPLIKNLSIKTYTSGSEEYRKLKNIEKEKGIFSADEAFIIKQWKNAKLVASQMTPNQIAIIKRYCLTDIKW